MRQSCVRESDCVPRGGRRYFLRAGILAAALIGLGTPSGHAVAQYYPPPAYPPAQVPPSRPVPLAGPDAELQGTPGSAAGDPRNVAALPPEVRPETGPKKELPPQFRRTLVDYYTKEPAGTIIIDTPNTYLYLVLGNGKALRYGIGVGREGFTWAGAEKISPHGGMARLESAGADDRAPALSAALHGRRRKQSARRARALSRRDALPHPRHQSALDHRHASCPRGASGSPTRTSSDLYARVKVGTRVVVLPKSNVATPVGVSRGRSVPGPSSDLPPTSDAPGEQAQT